MSFNLTELDPNSSPESDKLPPINLSNSISSPTLLTSASSSGASVMTITDEEKTLETFGSPEHGLTAQQCKKYFGNGARFRFYERQRWLYSQRANTFHELTSKKKNTLPGVMFDNEYQGNNDFPHLELNEEEIEKIKKEQEQNYDDDEEKGNDTKSINNGHNYTKRFNSNIKNIDNNDFNSHIDLDEMSISSQVSDLSYSTVDDLNSISSLELMSSNYNSNYGLSNSHSGDNTTNNSVITTNNTKNNHKRNSKIILPSPSEAVDRSIQPLSPRTKYIDNCLREKKIPRAGLLVRKKLSHELSMKNQGIGDKIAMLVAESLTDAPMIHSLNISGNRLTDKGMIPILDAVLTLPNLTELDLSQNKMGTGTSQALASYLQSKSCPLIKLAMSDFDIDDGECELFVAALKNNSTLIELDMSNNLLGSSEQLNVVMPDLVTGGEALAELLSLPACKLEVLKIAWNMIRLDSAVALSNSLHNTPL